MGICLDKKGRILKTLTVLCFGFLLTACTPIMANLGGTSQTAEDTTTDQQLFVEGVRQITQQQKPDLLLQLQDRFPGSLWADQAESILDLSEQISRQKKKIEQLEQQTIDLSSGKQIVLLNDQITQYASENKRLQEELDISNKRLEALRELTIELELK